MPFEIFRRHQRKLLAVLAIFAMVAFTLDFSLFGGGGSGGWSTDRVVEGLEVDGRPVRESELQPLRLERVRANLFMARLNPMRFGEDYFGSTSDEAMKEAFLLERRADELQMPRTPDVAKYWLRAVTDNQLTSNLFDAIYRENFTQEPMLTTDHQLLADIANQIRLQSLRAIPQISSNPLLQIDMSSVTPWDLVETYRGQSAKVNAEAISFPVDDYLGQVPQPSEAEVGSFYEEYKDQFPDPSRETPGFRESRKIAVAYITADVPKRADDLAASLPESDVRQYFERNRDEFPVPGPELPIDLFAGDDGPVLESQQPDPFDEVQALVRRTLAEERVADEVVALFDEAREELDLATEPASDSEEKPIDAEALAAKMKNFASSRGLPFDLLPAQGREELVAQRLAPTLDANSIVTANQGPVWSLTAPGFDQFLFESSPEPFSPFIMADAAGRRYLGWVVEDREPVTPPLAQIRDRVEKAWRRVKARDLAKSDAEKVASEVKSAGDGLRAHAGDRKVIDLLGLSEFEPPATFRPEEPRPTPLPGVDYPGDELRTVLFRDPVGTVEVAPNAPRTTYYVVKITGRTDPDLVQLFGPQGVQLRLEAEVGFRRSFEESRDWMDELASGGL